MTFEVQGIVHVSDVELEEILKDESNDAIVIDVREPHEYAQCHITGIPLIPMGEIVDYIDQFDKQREYIFVCRSGRRSLEVAKFFRDNGFDRARNYDAGMLGWSGDTSTGLENVIEQFNPEQLERKK